MPYRLLFSDFAAQIPPPNMEIALKAKNIDKLPHFL